MAEKWKDMPKAWADAPVDYKDPYWSDLAVKYAKKHGVPEDLALGVLLKGEQTNADEISESGAKTPFQFVPGTRKQFIDTYNIDPWASPDAAAESAAIHLKESLTRNATLPEQEKKFAAAAEYLGGPNWKKDYPAQASEYASKVTGYSQKQAEQISADNRANALYEEAKKNSPVWKRLEELRAQRLVDQEKSFYEKVPADIMQEKKQYAVAATPEVIQMYLDGKANNTQNPERMSPEERAEFERFVARGVISVPEGVITAPTVTTGATGAVSGLKEMVTGKERATPVTESRRDWSYLPEFEDMGMATKFAIMNASPEEAASMIKANFPKVAVGKDQKGNYVFKSGKTGEEFAIKPGLEPSDIVALGIRAIVTAPTLAAGAATGGAGGAALGALTRGVLGAGTRAALSAAGAGAAEEAAVQAAQGMTPGGEFSAGQVAAAGALGGALPVVGRAVAPLAKAAEPMIEAGKEAISRAARPYAMAAQLAQAVPEQIPVARQPIVARRPVARPPVSEFVEPGVTAAERAAMPEVNVFRRVSPEEISPIQKAVVAAVPDAPQGVVDDIVRFTKDVPMADAELAQLIVNSSKGGRTGEIARIQLAEMMPLNVEEAAQAKLYGFDVPDEYFIDSRRIRAIAGLEASQPGSQAEAIRRQTVDSALNRAEQVMKQFDAAYSSEGVPTLGKVSDDIRNGMVKQQAELKDEAQKIYQRVDSAMEDKAVLLDNLKSYFKKRTKEVDPSLMTSEEKSLLKTVNKSQYHKYGDLISIKKKVMQALEGESGPYAGVDYYVLVNLKKAITADQLDNVGSARIMGDKADEMRKALRQAHLLTAKQKGLEKRIVTLFGKDFIDNVPTGDISGKLVSAITEPRYAGGVGQIRKLLKMVPDEKKKEAVATAFATAVQKGDKISPAQFLSVKRAIDRSTFKEEFYRILGPGSKEALKATENVMRRMYLAMSQETKTTGIALAKTLENALATKAFNRFMRSSVVRSVTGTVGTAVGGGLGGAIGLSVGKPGYGAAIGSTAASAMATNLIENIVGTRSITTSLVDLIRDESFQKMMADAAKKNAAPSSEIVKKVSNSAAFNGYADQLGIPKDKGVRESFIWATFDVTPKNVLKMGAAQAARREMQEQ